MHTPCVSMYSWTTPKSAGVVLANYNAAGPAITPVARSGAEAGV